METGTPAGGSGAAPDPNFPQGLWIQPSSSKHRQARASTTRDLAASAAATRWDEDSQHDIDQYGIAGRIWEAAYLMAVYLRPPLHSALVFDPPCSAFLASERPDEATASSPRDEAGPSRIVAVELGSGAGFGGLHFAQQLCHHRISSKGDRTNSPEEATAYPDTVILTDLPNVVPLMERNAAAAGLLQSTTSPDESATGQSVHVLVRPLAWGDRRHAQTVLSELSLATSTQARRPAHPLTHVLCSDLVYFPELLPPLLRSLIDLTDPATGGNGGITTPTSSPEVIISYKIRSLVKEQPFWSAFGSWFDYQVVDCHRRSPEASGSKDDSARVDPWHRFGSRAADLTDSLEKDGGRANAAVPDDGALEDELFVFVAKRKPKTLGCRAPVDDAALMLGRRLRKRHDAVVDGLSAKVDLAAPTISEGTWAEEEGPSGQDVFEWILLREMGSAL